MKTPGFVNVVLGQFENQTESFNEAQVFDALRTARESYGDFTDEDFKGFQAEVSAFFFYERRNCDSPWGTYFAPTFTGTRTDGTTVNSPDIKELDTEVVAHWEARAKESKNPVLRARYADLVWDLSRPITDQRPDVQYARIAIDSYLEAAERGFYTIEVGGIQSIERALDLALSISDKERVKRTVDFMFAFYDRIASPQHVGTWVFLFDDLHGRKDLITSEREGEIVARLEDMLSKVCDRNNKETFDPWGAEAAAERLATHYRRQGDERGVTRVVKAYGEAFEHIAHEAKPMLAMVWLQSVFEKYQQTGLKDDAERVQLKVQEKAKNTAADMQEVRAEVRLSKEEINSYLNWIASGDLRTSLLRVAGRFIPDVSDARGFLAEMVEKFPLQALIGVVRIDDAQIVAQARSVEDDQEGRLHMQLAQNIQIS